MIIPKIVIKILNALSVQYYQSRSRNSPNIYKISKSHPDEFAKNAIYRNNTNQKKEIKNYRK